MLKDVHNIRILDGVFYDADSVISKHLASQNVDQTLATAYI